WRRPEKQLRQTVAANSGASRGSCGPAGTGNQPDG
ncbi:MAG: hypothetical protein, partial [Olavius algarvensis Gamma 3 endosymbiont]